jgi:thiol peroxidase
MAQITLGGNPVHTNANLPEVGTKLADLVLTGIDLKDVKLSNFEKRRVLNIFPSVDTGICATSVRKFNEYAAGLTNVEVLNVSADLPFAFKRFCGAEGITNVQSLSTFRSDAAKQLGIEMVDGAMSGLCARAVLVLDEAGVVLYGELVPEIAQEPNYDAALAVLK